jgi:hypothetical protein
MTLAVRLPPELEAELRQLAERTGHTLSDCVREACTAYVTEHRAADTGYESEAYRAGKHLFGCYDSREPDRVLRRKQIIRDRVVAKHRARLQRPR